HVLFFVITPSTPTLYPLSLHDALPIYARALGLFRHARAVALEIPTKSGIILGLGEERDELVATLRDLRAVGVSILTLGQYLRPRSEEHTSELQSRFDLVCRLLLEKKKR